MNAKTKIHNSHFIPLALYELGAVGRFIDIEDVFVKCYELAPERFGWRKHGFPNYKSAAKALRDLEGSTPELLLKTPDGLSRQLTAEGVRWVESRSELLADTLALRLENPPTRRTNQRLLNELSSHPIVQTYQDDEEFRLNKYEVADLLLCSPDSPVDVWRERLETYRSAAEDAKRPDVGMFLDYLFTAKPEWFGEKNE